MNLTRIISIILFIGSLALAYYLYSGIDETIEFRKKIELTESQIKDKLAVIREAEKLFLEQNGHYTTSWDSLINFIETGKVPITVRKEHIKQLSYGVEEVTVTIDTIGSITAREKIFKKTHTVNAPEDGTFLGFVAKEGQYVVKGAKSYKFKRNGSERVEEYTFLDKGTVSNLAKINVGDPVKKGQNLISFWDYQLNPDVDIKTLSIVPGSNKPFDIYTNWIDKNGIKVNVIEVKDPAPINPERKESNDAKNRRPLRFGSRTDVSTSGNWE